MHQEAASNIPSQTQCRFAENATKANVNNINIIHKIMEFYFILAQIHEH